MDKKLPHNQIISNDLINSNIDNKIKLPPLDFRIPKWNLEELQERICPICHNSDAIVKYIRPDSLTVKFCNKCDSFFISPAPSPQQLSNFYADYDKSHRRENKIKTKDLVKVYQTSNPNSDFRIQKLSNYIDLINAKVLDVGFGRARFLYTLMKLGSIPYGVELDDQAIEYAKALGIHNVNKGTIEDLDDKIKFNLIIMDDIVEHPLQPMSLLRKAASLLEKKGLLMIWTPNGEITGSEVCPTTFRVDLEHMQYLTPKSCLFIANEINLKIVHLETLGTPNLIGIDKPLIKGQSIKTQLKNVAKSIPGSSVLNNFFNKIRSKQISTVIEEKKDGAYHLYCIMQKSD